MMIDSFRDKNINLYADCIPVSGPCKSAIYDLTRQEIVRFPSAYLKILKKAQKCTIGSVLAEIEDEESKQSIIGFFNFLIENEFINFSVDTRRLPIINEIWDRPCVIQNAIIDIKTKPHDYKKLFQQLDTLGCEIVEIRCFSNLHTISEIKNILSFTYDTSIQGVELLLKYDSRYSDESYIKLIESEPIISRLMVHSAPGDKELVTTFGCGNATDATIMKKIIVVKDHLTSHRHCGVIQLSNINRPTTSLFFENKLYNGCLNRKVSIDEEGYIKNCPSMTASFGHHKYTSLIDVVIDNSFKNIWYINKDKIKKCQECEFRYACTDCRAYLENPNDIFSKPLKCGYDPYKGDWEKWHSNPDKEWAIKHYEFHKDVLNTDKTYAISKTRNAR
jgi:SPASM domain peptide maturase of grasp-with-spasm system